MDRRLVIVGIAVALALGVGVAALLVSPPGANPPGAAGPVGADDLPPGVNPDALGPRDSGLPTQGAAGRGRMTRLDDQRVTTLTWQTIEPTDAGVYAVGAPEATVRFSDSRALVVSAGHATIIAPQNTLRRGEFRDNVVLTFYDAQHGAVDFDSTRDIQVRVFLDEDAAFDLELGQITSAGPVHLTGPMADFQGTGLSLKYNRLRERLERLVVNEGKLLRFAAASQGRLSGGDEAGGDGADADAGAGDEDEAARVQFYRAAFADDIAVQAPGGPQAGQRADLTGDALEVMFAIRSGSVDGMERGGEADGSAVPAPAEAGPAEGGATDAAGVAQGRPEGRSLMVAGDDDVVVRWSGPLVVRPVDEDDAPDDPRAVELVVRGAPAELTTDAGDKVSGRTLGFVAPGERVSVVGDADAPLHVVSAELGELAGGDTRLEVSRRTGRGTVRGPGTLRAAPRDADAADAAASTIAWTQRMEFEMFAAASDTASGDGPRDAAFGALRRVAFFGDVATRAEGYQLDGQRIDVTFERDADDPSRSTPSRLMARGQVRAAQPGMRFSADALDAELSPRADDAVPTADADADAGAIASLGGQVRVDRVVAVGNVDVRIDQQQATVTAGRLVALPEKQTVELFGSADGQADTLAVLARPDGHLRGRHITLDQARQLVTIDGAGNFAHQLDEADPEAVLAVAWQKHMTFDNARGEATFLGGVQAGSKNAGDTSELTSDELVLRFEPADPDAEADAKPEDAAAASMRVRRLTAKRGVTFSATSRGGDADGPPRSRLLLEGPLLTFENTPHADPAKAVEQVTVTGEGRMLVENSAGSSAPVSEDKSTPVNFAGAGATLFLWRDSLTLDAARNDMTIVGTVQMIHRPADAPAEEVVQLDCQRLHADLTETGGLTAWSSEGGPDATLRLIECDGAVRLLQEGRRITADHLRYTAQKQAVVIWKDEGSVELIDEAGGSSMTAQAIKWDLANDAFEATKIRGGTAPIKRD